MEQLRKLREALSFSPDNVSLRKLIAQHLESLKHYEEAIEEYKILLKQEPHSIETKYALAYCYYKAKNYAPASIILEGLIGEVSDNINVWVLYSKLMLQEQNKEEALRCYQRVLRLNPDFVDDELDSVLRLPSQSSQQEENGTDGDSSVFVERPSLRFKDIGGMDEVKKEINLKIIAPLQHSELYAAYGKKAGGGVLLYGPPGCGKTYLAKATAGEIDSKFIIVGINDVLDMWMGNSEKNLHQLFEIARRNKPCVLFFDEIDALGANRSDMRQSAGKQLINQFLAELDGLNSNNEGILILGATNAPWHMDGAFRRPGRFDRIIFVSPPDRQSREAIFRIHLENKPTKDIAYDSLAKASENFSGADIKAAIDIAIEEKLMEAISTGTPQPITTKDLQHAIKKHIPSTQEWFSKARNFALYANDSGLYDDILHYLKINK